MSTQRKDEENGTVRVELKYCEHCGGLWVRERGAGTVYCDKCQAKVAELPPPKKKPGRLMLPVGRQSLAERYARDEDESTDLEAVGGAA